MDFQPSYYPLMKLLYFNIYIYRWTFKREKDLIWLANNWKINEEIEGKALLKFFYISYLTLPQLVPKESRNWVIFLLITISLFPCTFKLIPNFS